ncbi:type VI secretion system Vgr family protein [Thiohalorhabdus sp. Cl-TMA]|uniref:Type VI secretion system Vgr family protein n=1 Tax=Thiohalorhabdus methylotrophus TaxID=3242694 RepID=A0ABV4TSX3_9GAMM
MSEKVSYRFHCRGRFDGEPLQVVRFSGTEGISRLYRFRVELRSADPDLAPEEVLDKPWTLEMNVGGEQRVVHGIAWGFEELGMAGPDALYRVTLVPRLWRADQGPTSGVYLHQTVAETVHDLLEEDAGLTREDYELDLQTDYRQWPYRCQFGESPFHFLVRLLEREGICFFFEHDPEGSHEKLVITDHRGRQPRVPESAVTFAPDRGQEVDGYGRILRSLVSHHNPVPANVVVQDHNPDQPAVGARGEGMVAGGSGGSVYEYGDSVLDPEEGERLGRVRAEALQCRRRRFFGEGSAVGLLAGARFALEGHFRERFNREFLVTELEHSGHEPSLLVVESEPAGEPPYACSLTAVPGDVQYRPERSHDKPRFHGAMTAWVESEEEDAKYAFVDDQGRYKVRLPFDRKGGDRPSGKASHWVRTATPYGGREEGLHFRLRAGTEVLLTFLEGDPDRPVISGVATNREQTASQVEGDRTKHWLQTPGEVAIRFTDSEEEKGMDTLLWASWQTQVGDSGKFTSDVNTTAYDADAGSGAVSRPPNTEPFRPRDHAGSLSSACYGDDARDIGANGYPEPVQPTGYTDSPAAYTAASGDTKVRYRFVRRNADLYCHLVGDSYTWGGPDNRDFRYGRSFTVHVANESHYKQGPAGGGWPAASLIADFEGLSILESGKDGGPGVRGAMNAGEDWAEVKRHANVHLGAYDTIKAVDGNVYDYGGNGDYALGNGYEEALLGAVEGSWPLNVDWVNEDPGKISKGDLPDFQAEPGPGNDVTGKHIALDGGKAAISKTVDPEATGGGAGTGTKVGGVFDFVQADVIAVHRGAGEEHRQGHSYELAYDKEGTLRSQAWKEGTDYEEQKWDGNGVAYHFKKGYCWGGMDDWFEWSNMASMSLNMSLSSMSSTNIYAANSNTLNVFAGATSEISVHASAGLEVDLQVAAKLAMEFNAAVALNISAKALEIDLNAANGELEVAGYAAHLYMENGHFKMRTPFLAIDTEQGHLDLKLAGFNLKTFSGIHLAS